jgi:hypothetical protein
MSERWEERLSASPTTNPYSIEIKDVAGKPLVFINADWTDDEARGSGSDSATGQPSRPKQLDQPPEPNRN